MVTSVVAFVASVVASKNACFWCTAVHTRPDTRPCIWPCACIFNTAGEHGQDTRPCVMAVFSTASKFQKVDFELLLWFSHFWCIMDHILTCYAWINHLDHLQMLYLIKWLKGLLFHEICNSCIWMNTCLSFMQGWSWT